jgi:hypothetical protein
LLVSVKTDSVPAIATAVFLALVEMMIDLGVQGSFGKRLLQGSLSEISCEGVTMAKKETSYGETEATGYFRRAA